MREQPSPPKAEETPSGGNQAHCLFQKRNLHLICAAAGNQTQKALLAPPAVSAQKKDTAAAAEAHRQPQSHEQAMLGCIQAGHRLQMPNK
jgi:hypothetical protein